MTSEDGTYVYAAPFPEFYKNEGIKIPPCPEIIISEEAVPVTTGTITFSSPIQSELQMQVEELTKQNDLFMDALLYCISKVPEEEIRNDLRLRLIELATKMKREG